MKRKTGKRALALVLSALLVVGLIPSGLSFFNTTASGAPSTAGSWVMDAADLDVAVLGTDKLTADATVGTDGFFTIVGSSTTPKVDAKNSIVQFADDAKVDTPFGAYSQALNLGGGVKNNGQAGLKITIDKPVKVTAYVAVKAVNDKHSIQYAKDGGAVTTVCDMVNDTSVCNKVEFELDEAGTYYLGGNNGGNFFYVEVEYKKDSESFDVNSIDETLFDADNKGLLKADSTLGTNGFFSVTTEGNKVKYVTRGDVTRSYNNVDYPNALALDGKMQIKNSRLQAGISFTTTATTRVTILAAAKSTGASTFWFKNTDLSDVVTFDSAPLIYDTVQEYVINNLPAGTYYIGGSNGCDIFDIKVETVGAYIMDGNDIPDNLIDDANKVSTDTTVGTDDYFTVLGQGSKNQFKTSTGTSFNGKEYTKKIQLTGGAKLNSGQACMKISVKETARITMIAAAKGASGADTNIGIAKVGDKAITSMGKLIWNAAANAGDIQEYVLDNVKPGDYYIASDAGADIFEIKVEYDPLDMTQVDWEEVETPVITGVTVDADGNFVVSYEATVNKTEGAEKLYVIMYESGKEMATEVVAKQSDSVVMTPLWSGNYTFEVVAVRTGEVWKRSEKVDYNDYVLAVRKPVIIAEQNRGGGKYYIDWFNLSEADSYTVQIKQGSGDYTTVADNLTTANYELTGLAAGEYTVKVIATRNSDGFKSNYEKAINVTADAATQWYVATFGSAQETHAEITEAGGTVTNIDLSSRDNAAVKKNIAEAPNITNTNGTIDLAASDAGKISDGEEGFSYYYTYVDPNTENFKLTAKFTITDVSLTPDNQTGFGIIATDMPGINYFGAPDYYHKYYNEVSALFWNAKAPNSCMRIVTGYSNPDTSNCDDVERVMNQTNFKSDKNTTFTVGKEVTFSIEKTNDKYIVTCNGEEQELNDTALLSVQEDGSLCIGVMTSRKVGVKVSDITYTTSPSTGVSGAEKDTRVTPSTQIFSSGTTGSQSYEYIYAANTAGNLTVKLNGTEVYNKLVDADTAVRVPCNLEIGKNNIESEFKPTGTTATLTNTDTISKKSEVECKQYGKEDSILYVAPDGTTDGDGTYDKPLDLATIAKYAQPGQVIILKDGSYTKGVTIERSVSGTADKMITMVPENEGKVVFDTAALRLVGSYWHIYGLEVANVSSGNGILVAGNHNIVEMCVVHGSTNTGLQISRSGSANNKVGIEGEMWPSYNLIKNCESYDNCDPGRNDADGFAAKLTSGNGNVFYGCIAHHNIDDGWDLFAKTISGEIGSVTIENCVAYNNGWLTTDDTTAEGYNFGEGNGFKLGGGYLKGGHVLKNSISFANGAKGITSNSCPDCEVYNCTNFGNSVIKDKNAYNIGLNRKVSAVMDWKVSGLISMGDGNTKEADLFPVSLESATNYISNGTASYNTEGVEAVNSWFKNTDVSLVPTRNADGTINMHELLELLDTAPADTGARLDLTSEKAISVNPLLALADKDADYTAVDEAIAKAESLNKEDYVDFTAVESAVNAVVRGYKVAKQSEVDAMAQAILDAIDKLEKKPGTTPDTGEIEVNTDSDIPVTVEGTKEEIAEKIPMTDDEKKQYEEGAKIAITIEIKDIKDTVSETDKTAVEKLLSGETLGQYVDISVFKTIGDNPQSQITETSGTLKISIKLPENLKNTDTTKKREYYIVRVHDGVATKLDTVYNEADGTLTFASDKFSTYAIVYKDTVINNVAPSTGDTTSAAPFVILLSLSAVLMAGIYFYDKKRKALVKR